MSNFKVNDTVRIGKGTVEYIVEDVNGESVKVRGGKSNRAHTVEASRLSFVKAGGATVPEFYNEEVSSPETFVEFMDAVDAYVDGESLQVEELSLSTHNTIAESLEDGIFVLIDGNEPTRFKSFDAAAFAVSRDHTYRFATIVKDRGVTVQRKRTV